jgi:hypothetical protein
MVDPKTTDELVKLLNQQYMDIVSILESDDHDSLDTKINNYLDTVNKNIYLKSNSGDIVQLYKYNAETDNSNILINQKTAIIIYEKCIYIGFNKFSVSNAFRSGNKNGFGYVKIAINKNEQFEMLKTDDITKYIYNKPTSKLLTVYPSISSRGGGIKNLIDVFSKQFKGLKDNKNKTKRKKKLKRGKSSRISH